MSFDIRHAGGMNASRTHSGFWGNCPRSLMTGGDPALGVYFFDDFINPPNFAATDSDLNVYGTYGDTGTTVVGLASEPAATTPGHGVWRLTHDGTDNDAIVIRTGGSTGVMGVISDTAGQRFKLWCEARLRLSDVTDADGLSVFFGLSAEISLAATDTVQTTDTGVLKTTDYIGFRTLNAAAAELDTMYMTAGTEVVHKEIAQTLVVDTWYKLGLYYDGTGVYWFVNGVQVVPTTAGGARDSVGILPAATSFPDAEEVGLLLATKLGGATAATVDIDWWAFAQLSQSD